MSAPAAGLHTAAANAKALRPGARSDAWEDAWAAASSDVVASSEGGGEPKGSPANKRTAAAAASTATSAKAADSGSTAASALSAAATRHAAPDFANAARRESEPNRSAHCASNADVATPAITPPNDHGMPSAEMPTPNENAPAAENTPATRQHAANAARAFSKRCDAGVPIAPDARARNKASAAPPTHRPPKNPNTNGAHEERPDASTKGLDDASPARRARRKARIQPAPKRSCEAPFADRPSSPLPRLLPAKADTSRRAPPRAPRACTPHATRPPRARRVRARHAAPFCAPAEPAHRTRPPNGPSRRRAAPAPEAGAAIRDRGPAQSAQASATKNRRGKRNITSPFSRTG